MSDIRLCQGIIKNRVVTEHCKFSCTSDFTVVVIDFYTLTHTCVQATMSPLQLYLYRYPHNFCKYEMLPIPCCIIIPLMWGLSCGLQKLYMDKHGSGNRLEQERKQHTSISYHARALPAHAQPRRLSCARECQTPTSHATFHCLNSSYNGWRNERIIWERYVPKHIDTLLHNIYMNIRAHLILYNDWFLPFRRLFCGHGCPRRATQWYASHISLHVWQKWQFPTRIYVTKGFSVGPAPGGPAPVGPAPGGLAPVRPTGMHA